MAGWPFRADDFGTSHLELRVQAHPLSGTHLERESDESQRLVTAGTSEMSAALIERGSEIIAAAARDRAALRAAGIA